MKANQSQTSRWSSQSSGHARQKGYSTSSSFRKHVAELREEVSKIKSIKENHHLGIANTVSDRLDVFRFIKFSVKYPNWQEDLLELFKTIASIRYQILSSVDFICLADILDHIINETPVSFFSEPSFLGIYLLLLRHLSELMIGHITTDNITESESATIYSLSHILSKIVLKIDQKVSRYMRLLTVDIAAFYSSYMWSVEKMKCLVAAVDMLGCVLCIPLDNFSLTPLLLTNELGLKENSIEHLHRILQNFEERQRITVSLIHSYSRSRINHSIGTLDTAVELETAAIIVTNVCNILVGHLKRSIINVIQTNSVREDWLLLGAALRAINNCLQGFHFNTKNPSQKSIKPASLFSLPPGDLKDLYKGIWSDRYQTLTQTGYSLLTRALSAPFPVFINKPVKGEVSVPSRYVPPALRKSLEVSKNMVETSVSGDGGGQDPLRKEVLVSGLNFVAAVSSFNPEGFISSWQLYFSETPGTDRALKSLIDSSRLTGSNPLYHTNLQPPLLPKFQSKILSSVGSDDPEIRSAGFSTLFHLFQALPSGLLRRWFQFSTVAGQTSPGTGKAVGSGRRTVGGKPAVGRGHLQERVADVAMRVLNITLLSLQREREPVTFVKLLKLSRVFLDELPLTIHSSDYCSVVTVDDSFLMTYYDEIALTMIKSVFISVLDVLKLEGDNVEDRSEWSRVSNKNIGSNKSKYEEQKGNSESTIEVGLISLEWVLNYLGSVEKPSFSFVHALNIPMIFNSQYFTFQTQYKDENGLKYSFIRIIAESCLCPAIKSGNGSKIPQFLSNQKGAFQQSLRSLHSQLIRIFPSLYMKCCSSQCGCWLRNYLLKLLSCELNELRLLGWRSTQAFLTSSADESNVNSTSVTDTKERGEPKVGPWGLFELVRYLLTACRDKDHLVRGNVISLLGMISHHHWGLLNDVFTDDAHTLREAVLLAILQQDRDEIGSVRASTFKSLSEVLSKNIFLLSVNPTAPYWLNLDPTLDLNDPTAPTGENIGECIQDQQIIHRSGGIDNREEVFLRVIESVKRGLGDSKLAVRIQASAALHSLLQVLFPFRLLSIFKTTSELQVSESFLPVELKCCVLDEVWNSFASVNAVLLNDSDKVTASAIRCAGLIVGGALYTVELGKNREELKNFSTLIFLYRTLMWRLLLNLRDKEMEFIHPGELIEQIIDFSSENRIKETIVESSQKPLYATAFSLGFIMIALLRIKNKHQMDKGFKVEYDYSINETEQKVFNTRDLIRWTFEISEVLMLMLRHGRLQLQLLVVKLLLLYVSDHLLSLSYSLNNPKENTENDEINNNKYMLEQITRLLETVFLLTQSVANQALLRQKSTSTPTKSKSKVSDTKDGGEDTKTVLSLMVERQRQLRRFLLLLLRSLLLLIRHDPSMDEEIKTKQRSFLTEMLVFYGDNLLGYLRQVAEDKQPIVCSELCVALSSIYCKIPLLSRHLHIQQNNLSVQAAVVEVCQLLLRNFSTVGDIRLDELPSTLVQQLYELATVDNKLGLFSEVFSEDSLGQLKTANTLNVNSSFYGVFDGLDWRGGLSLDAFFDSEGIKKYGEEDEI